MDFSTRVHFLKRNNEYHGLERHARQYHLSAMYDFAAGHWLIAAGWRHDITQHAADKAHTRRRYLLVQVG
jgi:hypothetical protein